MDLTRTLSALARLGLAAARPDRKTRRLLAGATLALLFLAGPVHVWHHITGASFPVRSTDDAGQCVPCSTFHKIFGVETTVPHISWARVCVGVIAPMGEPLPAECGPVATPSRAPPCPLA